MVERNKDGTIKPGSVLNPEGKNSKIRERFSLEALLVELNKEGERLGKSPYQHIAEQFYTNNDVMKAVLNKILPNLSTMAVANTPDVDNEGIKPPSETVLDMDTATVGDKVS